MKTLTFGNLSRLLVAIFFAAFLASCSSSSSTDDSQMGGNFDLDSDLDGDGDVDFADGDYDGNGIVDNADLDFNGDGITDANDDRNGDGFVDFEDFDINGDDVNDANDDTNGDGLINSSDVINLGPCEGLSGSDPNSSNNEWDDNCTLSASAPYKDSSYSRGIQRILWCQGFAPVGQPLATFADGSYGPNTATAVTAFQNSLGLDPDGIVGPDTWGALRDTLELLSTGTDYDTWGVNSVDCNGQAMFYQRLDTNLQGISWEMAETPGSTNRVVFSTGF